MACPITEFTYATTDGATFYIYGNDTLNRWVATTADKKKWVKIDASGTTSVGNYVVDATKTPVKGGTCKARESNSDPLCASTAAVTPPPQSVKQSSSKSVGSFSELFNCTDDATCKYAAQFNNNCCGSVKDQGPCPGTLALYGSNAGTFCVTFTNNPNKVVVQAQSGDGKGSTGLVESDGASIVSAPLLNSEGAKTGVVAKFDFTASPGKAPVEVIFSYPNLPGKNFDPPAVKKYSTFPAAVPDNSEWTKMGSYLCCKSSGGGDAFFSSGDGSGDGTDRDELIALLLIIAGASILSYVVWKRVKK